MSIWQHMYVLRTKWAKCFRKSQIKFVIDHSTTSHTEAMNRSMKHGSQALASMNLDRSADKLVKHSNNALDRKERWVLFNYRKISITSFTSNMCCSYAVRMQNSWAQQSCGPGSEAKDYLTSYCEGLSAHTMDIGKSIVGFRESQYVFYELNKSVINKRQQPA